MEDIQALKLGVVEHTSGMGRPTKILRNRKSSDLSDQQTDLLFKKIKVDKAKYIA